MRSALAVLGLILLGPLPLAARPAAPGAVTGQVTVVDKAGAARPPLGVVVYLDVKEEGELPPVTGEIRQRELAFAPALTVVTRGSQVGFPNQDKVFHNVFSVSRAAPFDLGLYKSGTRKSVTFTEVGVVDVYCNIHPQMVAKVKVLDSPHFAITDAGGSFVIERVPPGTYPVVAWHPSGGEARGSVVVAPQGKATVSLQVVEQPRSRRHLRKDNTAYPGYR